MIVVVTGDKVRLRPFESGEEYRDLLTKMSLEEDHFWGYGWWIPSRMIEQFNQQGKLGEEEGFSMFAIDRLDTNQAIGYEVVQIPKPPQIKSEIGTVILREHWSNGFGREAKLLATDWVFENLAVERVSATTLSSHHRAIAGLKATNFIHEGTIRLSQFSEGRYVGKEKFRILRSDWESRRYTLSKPVQGN